MMFSNTRSLLVATALLSAAGTAQAAFIAGVETFTGTTKDISTWEDFTAAGATISQNNALSINTTGNGSQEADYTTLSQTVGIGDTFRVDVRPVTNSGYYAAVALTNNSAGSGSRYVADSQFIHFNITSGSITAQEKGGSSSSVSSGLALNTTYVLEIERLSATQSEFTVFQSNGITTVGSPTTLTHASIPGGLNISLYGVDLSVVEFDNATVVPEPATLGLLGLAGLLARRGRKI